MNAAIDRKLALYSSLFITLALNMPKLLALRKDGVVAHFWHFDLGELLCEMVLNFLFCLAIFYYNQPRLGHFFRKWHWPTQGPLLGMNLLILGLFTLVAVALQRLLFTPSFLYGGGNGFRFTLSLILMAIELRVSYLVQESKAKEVENEHLRNAYLKSELDVLKGQLNPHFFFNALSSLSAIVRENPPLAQQYISHLSKVFRYSLRRPDSNIVPLKEEIDAVNSYAQLMKMRHEDGFQMHIRIADGDTPLRLPHMSLQPLVENALKHNLAISARPLRIDITQKGHLLEVKNNIQPAGFNVNTSGIGLSNLNERFRILLGQEIEIIKTEDTFIVNLPLT